MSLVREQFVSKPCVSEPRRIPGTAFGPDAFVRKLTVVERFEFDKLREKIDTDPTVVAKMALFLICKEDGSREFTDKDADFFANQSGYADSLRWICEEGAAFNSLSRESIEEAKKNSPETGNGSPPSDSPTI